MTAPPLPLSGYALLNIYAAHLEMSFREMPEAEGAVIFGWDWRILHDNVFEVRIDVSVEPTKERELYLEAAAVGRFRRNDGEPGVSLDEFVSVQSIAILLPYARQYLSSLSASSLSGLYLLPPVNVIELVKDFDPKRATGAKQLAERAAETGASGLLGGDSVADASSEAVPTQPTKE